MDASVIVIGSMGIVGMLIVASVGLGRRKEVEESVDLAFQMTERYSHVVERQLQMVEKAMAVMVSKDSSIEPRLALGLAQTLTRPAPETVKMEPPVRTEVSGVTVRMGKSE